jgi:hypothetical protein
MARRSGARDGGALAVRDFFLRHHVLLLSLVLSALGLVTGPATMAAYLQGFSPSDTAALLAGAMLAGAAALVQTRHLPLAILMGIAPLPGLAWAAPLAGDASFGAVPFIAYGFGFAVAVLAADDIVRRELHGGPRQLPWCQIGSALGLTVALAAVWFWRSRFAAAAVQAVADMALVTLSVLIVVPLGAVFLHFDEGFVARANRVREWRLRLLDTLGGATTPRWGLSLGGIAAIFLALAWFGAEPLFSKSHMQGAPFIAAASTGLVFAFALVAGTGWREGFGSALVGSATGLMALWGFAKLGQFAPSGLAAVGELIALAALPVFCGAVRAHTYRKLGEGGARAVEETGAAQFFAAFGAIMALLPGVIVHHSFAVYEIGLLFAGIGALVFAPALGAAVETLLPRRRSVEELYGRG